MADGTKKLIITVVAIALVAYAVYAYWSNFGQPTLPADTRTLMDPETGKLYEVAVDENFGPFPHVNPDTGKRTLWPTEVCFARECAKKEKGTHVILNSFLGKEGPTYCPNCGALVRPHNPGRVTTNAGDASGDDVE
jgi:hypothetical protein